MKVQEGEFTKTIEIAGGKEGRLRFVLLGPAGAVQFMMLTGWSPAPEGVAVSRFAPRIPKEISHLYPMAADLGYHWPTPRHEGQTMMEHCDALPQGNCYYDGSGLNAEPVMELLFKEGEEAVWNRLREYYERLKGEEE